MEMKNMKYIIGGIIVVLFLSIGANIYQFLAATQQQLEKDALTGEVESYQNLYSPVYKYFTALTVEEFKQKVASGEHFTVYIGRPDCGDCTAFEPTFEDVINERSLGNKMYYLNVKWLREGDKTEWENFKKTYGFTQTPAFSTYEGGAQTNMIEWTDKGLPRTELETWLRTEGII